MRRFLYSLLLAFAYLVPPLQAQQLIVRASGGDDSNAIQSALDNSLSVLIPDPVYLLSKPIVPRRGTTITGGGLWNTSLEATDRNVLILLENDTITLRGFGITQNARRADPRDPQDFGDYNQGGKYAIEAGRGRGSNHAPKNITLNQIYVHDTHTTAVAAFAGVVNWNVTNCRVERTGRGGIVSNAFRNSRFIGNYFGRTGDDALAINGMSHNCTVTGNVFVGCGDMGITKASGIKCHGQAITITGNTFYDCHVAISFQASMKMSRRDGYQNGVGACGDCVFSDNTIYGVCNSSMTTQGMNHPTGIRISGATNLKLTGNTIVAISADGTPRPSLSISGCRGIDSSGNTYVGASAKISDSRDVEFYRDTFHPLDGKNHLFRMFGTHDVSARFDHCRMPYLPKHMVFNGSGGNLDVETLNTRTVSRRRIGFLLQAVTAGEKELTLDESHQSYQGIQIKLANGQTVYVCDDSTKEKVKVVGDYTANDSSISVSPLVNDYAERTAWIELAEPESSRAVEPSKSRRNRTGTSD